ncbi:MAG: 6-hydroxymethylpterin diphosphokinase MptE-like protein [Pseudomonadota bacterium]
MHAQVSPTDLQSIASQMQSRFLDNLGAFREHLPELFELLVGLPPDAAPIDLSDQGMRLLFNGKDVYPDDPWIISQQQVDQFVLRPNSFSLYPVPPEDDGIKQHAAMIKLIPPSEIAPRQIESYEFDRINAPMLLCFGIGSGFHIEQLLGRLNLRHLILFEASPALLRASLYCIDWRDIFAIFSKPGRHLDIILTDDVDVSASNALHSIRQYSPIFSNVFLMFDHLQGDFYDELKRHLKSLLSISVQGMGFYDDELQGMAQTYANLRDTPPILHHAPARRPKTAFVIGSGPSLNTSLEHIVRNRNSAVVFTCGSSIGPLLANGIVPDFHLEQERHQDARLMLELLEHREQLKEIHLIMLNVVPPEIRSLFKSHSLALKGHDAAAHMFPPGTPQLNYSTPTVTNFGVSLCTYLNFEQVYLFGVDLAIKDVRAHHANATAYDQWDLDNWLKTLESSLTRSMQGNFGDTVRSTDLYNWARVHFEYIADIEKGKREYFNCSDGALITGFKPQDPCALSLDENISDRRKSVRNVRDCFSRKTQAPEYFTGALPIVANDFTRLADELVVRFSTTFNSREAFIENVDLGYLAIHDTATQRATQVVMGAIYKHFMLLINAYSSAIKDQAIALQYINNALPVFCEFVQWASKDLETFTAHPDAVKPKSEPVAKR